MHTRFTKKAFLICTSFVVLIFSFGFVLCSIVNTQTTASPYNLTIVLDAGHGGIDGGSVGSKTNITESELNLAFTLKLERLLKSVGINVVKTRTNQNGLASNTSKNFKKEDMQKRKEIISQANAQALVSIHMNKFGASTEKGAQVFYQKDDDTSKKFATAIMDELVSKIDNARKLVIGGDYFICKCDQIPSVIVECGFLSNEQEELLLQNEEYQDKFCYAVFCGIMKYFNSTINSY